MTLDPTAASSNKFRSDVSWNFASLVVLGLSGVALNVLIGLYWDAATLGVFNQALAAYILFSQAAVGGINLSSLRAIAEHPQNREHVSRVTWACLAPAALLALVVTAIYWFAREPLGAMLDSPAVAEGIAWSTPGLFFFAINKVLLSITNGLGRMRAFAIFTSIRYLGILVALLVALRLEMPGERLAYVFSAAEIVLFVLLAIDVGRVVDWTVPLAFGSAVREHVVYGAKSVLSGVLLELNAKVDIWMIGVFLSDKLVGVYTFAAMIAEGVFQLLVVLQNNYNPVLARLLVARDFVTLKAVVAKGRKWTYVGLGGVAVLAVALYPVALSLLTNKPSFEEGYVPFGILMAGIALASGYIPFGQTLLMANQPGWHTLLMIFTVLVNVIGNWILIPIYGLDGAATATAISMGASVIFLKILVKRRVGVWI